MEPCLLCVLQRWTVMLLGTVFLVASLHHARAFGYRIYAFLTFIISIIGAIAAGRQVWLQHQPLRRDEVCVPGLDYLLKTHPLPEVLRIMIRGGHDCAVVTWRFLSLTMAEWVLIFFIFLALLSLYQLFRKYLSIHSQPPA